MLSIENDFLLTDTAIAVIIAQSSGTCMYSRRINDQSNIDMHLLSGGLTALLHMFNEAFAENSDVDEIRINEYMIFRVNLDEVNVFYLTKCDRSSSIQRLMEFVTHLVQVPQWQSIDKSTVQIDNETIELIDTIVQDIF